MSRIGLFLIIASVGLAAGLFFSIPNVRDPIALFSQYIGAAALILMAWAQLMATRLPFVEPIFGGLDRVYVLHKWSGVTALLAILIHDTVDAEIRGLGPETALVELGETLGELSLYGLLVLGVISVATFIPYHLWKWTHRVMGAFFAAGAVHYVLELKPFSATTDPVGIYITGFCGLGLLAYGYTLLPETSRRARFFTVSGLRQTGGATEITLTPNGESGLRPQPGQFAIFSFDAPGLAEPHPYSLSAPVTDTGQIQITVKALGDYTTKLARDLRGGAQARVQGPFGRFTRRSDAPEIWIAGGIGITPFLAWAEALPPDQTHPIHLFWAIRNRDEAPQLDRIQALSHPALTVHLCDSSQGNRLSPDQIAEVADLSRAKAYFCGPAPMRRALATSLARHGLSARNFHYEEFEFRTGVGLKRLAAWLLPTKD